MSSASLDDTVPHFLSDGVFLRSDGIGVDRRPDGNNPIYMLSFRFLSNSKTIIPPARGSAGQPPNRWGDVTPNFLFDGRAVG
jgi:hypothetical protein